MVVLRTRLKSVREERHIRQEDLAEAAGVSVRTIARLEQEKIDNPSGKLMLQIAKFLDVQVEYLFWCEDVPFTIE